MGHAGLFVEAGEERILVDPILRTSAIGSQSMVHSYARALDLETMPKATMLVLTHGHLDHFDPSSLKLLDRTLPFVVPNDQGLLAALRQLGFERLIVLANWGSHDARGVSLRAVPSYAGVDEFGLLFCEGETRFLHLADAEPSLEDAQRLRKEYGPLEAASVKFQPAAPAHGVFRSLGPYFDKRTVIEWLDCIAEVAPRFAFPYASGIRFDGRHAWLNRYAFPFRGSEVAELLAARFDRHQTAATVLPGDVIELAPGVARHLPQSSPFIRHDGGPGEPAWEPFDSTTLAGLDREEECDELESLLVDVLRQELAPWLAERRNAEGSPIQSFITYGVVYQLVIHLAEARTLDFSIDFRQPRLRLVAEQHPSANYFAHVSGRALLDVLRGAQGPELFYLSGDARIYEKILAVREGAFAIPPTQGWDLFERLPEPLTHYLRHTRPSC